MQLSRIGFELRGRKFIDDAAVLHDVVPIGDRRGKVEILLDQENGEALRLQRTDGLADLLDDNRRQTFGRLVEQQQAGAGTQDATDRQHLLLAAGQFRALT